MTYWEIVFIAALLLVGVIVDIYRNWLDEE